MTEILLNSPMFDFDKEINMQVTYARLFRLQHDNEYIGTWRGYDGKDRLGSHFYIVGGVVLKVNEC